MLMQKRYKLMTNKRTSSTIPYGYKLTEDKTLEPVEKEINALKDARRVLKQGHSH